MTPGHEPARFEQKGFAGRAIHGFRGRVMTLPKSTLQLLKAVLQVLNGYEKNLAASACKFRLQIPPLQNSSGMIGCQQISGTAYLETAQYTYA